MTKTDNRASTRQRAQKRICLLLLLMTLTLASGCHLFRAKHQIPPNPSNPIYTVAVMPVYNATNDLNGPDMLREMVHNRVAELNYSVKGLEETDILLRDNIGVTLGEQLDTFDTATPQKIGEALGVDGIVYIYLINFDDKTTVLYNVTKVRAGIKLVDTLTGKTVWADGRGVKGEITSGGAIGKGIALGAMALDAKDDPYEEYKTIKGMAEVPNLKNWQLLYHRDDSPQNALILSLGGRILTSIARSHLRFETYSFLQIIFPGFPSGPGQQVRPLMAGAPSAPIDREPKKDSPKDDKGTTVITPGQGGPVKNEVK